MFILVHDVRMCSNFIDLHTAVLLFLHYFFPFYILASSVKDQLTVGEWVFFWALYSAPLISISIFVPVPHCLDYYLFNIVLNLEEGRGLVSCYVLSPHYYFGNSGSSVLLFSH